MKKKGKNEHANFANVKNIHDDLVPEEFPEGPLGSPIRAANPVESKSTPWKKGQRRQSAFIYSDKEIHEGLPRQAPGAHPLNDSEMKNSED